MTDLHYVWQKLNETTGESESRDAGCPHYKVHTFSPCHCSRETLGLSILETNMFGFRCYVVLALLARVGVIATNTSTTPSKDLTLLSIREAGEYIRNGSIRSTQLFGAYLKRIDEVDGRLRSFIAVARENALFAAQQADDELANGTYRGPLHGIPFGIKTCTSVETYPRLAILDSILASYQNRLLRSSQS